MRILHTGDWHLGKSLEGKSRMDEQEAFLKDFVSIVEREKIDLVLIAGDVYDSSNPPARAEKMFYDTLKKLSSNGERLIVAIAGNHDSSDRLVAATPLAMEHGIIMVGTPKTIVPVGDYGMHKVLNSGEGFVEVEINNEKAVMLTVPYPSEKRLNEVLYGDMDSEEERLETYGDRIKLLFNNLKSNYREDTINLAISHLFTMGSEAGGSERNITLGGSYIVNSSCFPKEAQYIALGHVHKPQVVPGTEKKARYSGSPIHYNKNEIGFKKKCFLIDVKPKEEAIINEIELDVYKPIEIWKCDSIEDAINRCSENKDKECWVYLEVKTDEYIREDQIKEMKDLKKDILEIIPKISSNEEDLEIESLSKKSFEDIFKEFYKKERDVEPNEELVNLLLSIVSEEDEENETN